MFDGRKPFIRRSDLGARGVYFRVLVGTFTRVDEANQFCTRLKKAGGDCLVQKN
jgi:cell division septation protein DedD